LDQYEGDVMFTVFSLRHKPAIDDKKIIITLPVILRNKILMVIERHNYSENVTSYTGYNYHVDLFNEKTKEELKLNYGGELKEYEHEERVISESMNSFILNAWPFHVMDAIEAFSSFLEEDDKKLFEQELNQALKSENSNLRIMDSYFIILDSCFLESEILSKAYELMQCSNFEVALKYFVNARGNFTSGYYEGVLVECNNTLESLLQNVTNYDRSDQKKLKSKLMSSNIIPDYFQGFADGFEIILQSAFAIANNAARHGKIEIPEYRNIVTREVAQFMLGLTGSLIIFIIERYIEFYQREKKHEEKNEDSSFEDIDIPF
jgi:hypothetical protein